MKILKHSHQILFVYFLQLRNAKIIRSCIHNSSILRTVCHNISWINFLDLPIAFNKRNSSPGISSIGSCNNDNLSFFTWWMSVTYFKISSLACVGSMLVTTVDLFFFIFKWICLKYVCESFIEMSGLFQLCPHHKDI